MSIASEITSIGENLKKDYQAIANLGADLTNVDKNIENIAELLDGVYDNLPKTEYQEGTDIAIENGLKGKLDFEDDIVGIGQSSQDGTPTPSTPIEIKSVTGTIEEVVSGKNLVSFPYSSQAGLISGVNWSVNADGTINATGTANAASSIFYLRNGDDDLYLDPGTYKISTNVFTDANGFGIQVIQIVNGSYGTVYFNDMVLTERTRLRVRILAKANAVVNKTNGYLMIERGNQATAYEKYITPTSYQLSLGDRKVYEGDYLWRDTNGKFYHHHKMGEDTFSNQDTWYLSSDNNKSIFFRPINSKANGNLEMLCKIFKFNETSWQSLANYEMCGQADNKYIFIRCDDYDNVTSFQNAVNGKSLVYPLATETDEEITGTLAEQLEAWWNGQSLDGTTIIEGNGDLPMIIKVRGLKGE